MPIKALIIQKDRAVHEMLWAIERGKANHMFPKRIRWPVLLARQQQVGPSTQGTAIGCGRRRRIIDGLRHRRHQA